MDAFDVLGLAPLLELDPSELTQRYRDLQRQLHPDKFVHASSSERRASLARAVSVNEAYRLLKDPLKRADLVFARLTGMRADEGQATVEPALLMEVMELREQLATARKQRDLALALRLKGDVSACEQAALGELERAFASLATASTAEARDAATRALTRLRYYRRFQEEVASFEDDAAASVAD